MGLDMGASVTYRVGDSVCAPGALEPFESLRGMNIKIECACGARFAFDVEPVDGQMPVEVQCPECGADGTAKANEFIREQWTTARPKAGPIRVRVVTPPSEAESPTAPGPPVAGLPSVLPAPEADAGVAFCSRHPRELAVAECAVCQKPICARCLQQFGYLCSVYCQEQARARNIEVPVFAGRKTDVAVRERRKGKLLAMIAGAVAVALLTLWVWYAFVGSRPRVAWTFKPPASEPLLAARWVGADRVVTLTGQKLRLHNAANGKELWASPLKADEQVGNKAGDDDEFDRFAEVQLSVADEDVWIGFPSRVVRYAAGSGKREQEFPLPQPLERLTFTPTAIVAVAPGLSNQNILTRIDFGSRQARTETALPLPGAGAGGRGAGVRLLGALRPAQRANRLADALDLPLDLRDEVSEFHPAGQNVAHLAVALRQQRIVSREAAQAPEKESMLERSSLRAADSAAAGAEFLRNTRNTGGAVVDESRYLVTLRRFFSGSLNLWSEEVTGPPAFFALQTVDVLTAGKRLIVFSKTNQKLWEAKLAYPVSPRFTGEPGSPPQAPCFEAGNRLFLFDQGTLTAFELKTGKVQFQATSVFISQAVLGRRGRVYVATTSAPAQIIPSSQEPKFSEEILPLVLGVDAANGKVLWATARVGEQIHVTGDFLYASRAQGSKLGVFAASGDEARTPVHYRIYRLAPESGKELWEYYQPRAPVYFEPRENRLLLQYEKEVQLLKFLSL
jgi:hypothetical protein